MSAYICAICKTFTRHKVDKKPHHCEKRGIYGNRLSLSQERNVSNLGYQRFQGSFQGQQLQPYLEIPEDGLADLFVIKHTRDDALLRDLLCKYGFKAADATQNSNPQLTGSKLSTLICLYCGRIPAL